MDLQNMTFLETHGYREFITDSNLANGYVSKNPEIRSENIQTFTEVLKTSWL